MIETFKILHKYDPNVTPCLKLNSITSTRGHARKLFKIRANRNTRKNFFTLRICNLWNSLPELVVESKDVLQFEKRIDFWWRNAEFKFDYKVPPPDRANFSDITVYHQELDIEEQKILRPELNLM